MNVKTWIGIVLIAAVVVLAVAWEAPTTKASGWPHDPVLFIPALFMVVFCGLFLVFAPRFEDGDQHGKNSEDGRDQRRG